MKKCIILLNEKTEFIPSSEIKCPESGIFTITPIFRRVESGKAIWQVSTAVFFGCWKYFSGKDGSVPPLEQISPYAYEQNVSTNIVTLIIHAINDDDDNDDDDDDDEICCMKNLKHI